MSGAAPAGGLIERRVENAKGAATNMVLHARIVGFVAISTTMGIAAEERYRPGSRCRRPIGIRRYAGNRSCSDEPPHPGACTFALCSCTGGNRLGAR